MIRAVFLGTPPAAIPALAALASVAEVTAVVTRPDRPRGRSGHPSPPAVKEAALTWGMHVEQPDKIAGAAHLLKGTDVAVVVAYGRLIPARILELPHAGFINLHFSVLPRWRGAAPVARAILAGDVSTGVSLMRIDEGLDTGPVGAMREIPIRPSDTTGTLTARLAGEGADLLRATIGDIVAGRTPFTPQPDDGVTTAPPVTVEEAHLRPSAGRQAVDAAVRAFNPAPGAWGSLDGQRFKVWSVQPQGTRLDPGALAASGGRVLLGTGDGSVRLLEVQPAGRSRMDAGAWWRGLKTAPSLFE